MALGIKNPPANAGDAGDMDLIPRGENPLEEGMATHSSILAWRIPWTEEPGGRQSMGPQTARDDRACTRRMQNTTSEINSAFMMG